MNAIDFAEGPVSALITGRYHHKCYHQLDNIYAFREEGAKRLFNRQIRPNIQKRFHYKRQNRREKSATNRQSVLFRA